MIVVAFKRLLTSMLCSQRHNNSRFKRLNSGQKKPRGSARPSGALSWGDDGGGTRKGRDRLSVYVAIGLLLPALQRHAVPRIRRIGAE